MAAYSYETDIQKNYGWSLTFNMGVKAPAIADRIFDTLAHAYDYINDIDSSAIVGLSLSVISDGDANGIYFVEKICSAKDAKDGVLVKVGSDEGSTLIAENYSKAIEMATEDRLGKVIFVKNDESKYKYEISAVDTVSQHTTTISSLDELTDDFLSGQDAENGPNWVSDETHDGSVATFAIVTDGHAQFYRVERESVEYAAGPYIVTGANTVAPLSTSIAGETDLTSVVSTLQGKVSNNETSVSDIKAGIGEAPETDKTVWDAITEANEAMLWQGDDE